MSTALWKVIDMKERNAEMYGWLNTFCDYETGNIDPLEEVHSYARMHRIDKLKCQKLSDIESGAY